jgi:hypothetical protein
MPACDRNLPTCDDTLRSTGLRSGDPFPGHVANQSLKAHDGSHAHTV